jgi:hypothetical protein
MSSFPCLEMADAVFTGRRERHHLFNLPVPDFSHYPDENNNKMSSFPHLEMATAFSPV